MRHIALILAIAWIPLFSVVFAALPSTAPSTEPSERRFGSAPSAATPLPPFPSGRLDLAFNETVTFAGQTNLVRAQQAGYLESQLAAHFAARKPRFRNMAWEGDTVYEQWRDENFGGWRDQLAWAGATAVIAQFGQTESLDGPERLADFTAAYAALIDQWSKTTRRIVLISPMPFEKPPSPLIPGHTGANQTVRAYADAVRKLAEQRSCIYVDVFSPLIERRGEPRLTSNGMHLSGEGHRVLARLISKQLGFDPLPDESLEPLRAAIIDKNRLWFENWRPMNWAFAYGNRQHVPFGHAINEKPPLRIELEQFKPLITAADEKIHDIAVRAAEKP